MFVPSVKRFGKNVYIYKKISAEKEYDFFYTKISGKNYNSECDYKVR